MKFKVDTFTDIGKLKSVSITIEIPQDDLDNLEVQQIVSHTSEVVEHILHKEKGRIAPILGKNPKVENVQNIEKEEEEAEEEKEGEDEEEDDQSSDVGETSEKVLEKDGWWRSEDGKWHCPNNSCNEEYNDGNVWLAYDWPLNKPGYCGSCTPNK